MLSDLLHFGRARDEEFRRYEFVGSQIFEWYSQKVLADQTAQQEAFLPFLLKWQADSARFNKKPLPDEFYHQFATPAFKTAALKAIHHANQIIRIPALNMIVMCFETDMEVYNQILTVKYGDFETLATIAFGIGGRFVQADSYDWLINSIRHVPDPTNTYKNLRKADGKGYYLGLVLFSLFVLWGVCINKEKEEQIFITKTLGNADDPCLEVKRVVLPMLMFIDTDQTLAKIREMATRRGENSIVLNEAAQMLERIHRAKNEKPKRSSF